MSDRHVAATLFLAILGAGPTLAQPAARSNDQPRVASTDRPASDLADRGETIVDRAYPARSQAPEYTRLQVIPSMAVWGILVPDDYQQALFENLVRELRKTKTFPEVLAGDAEGDAGTLKLATIVTEFNPGDQEMRRGVGLGFGTARMKVRVRFLDARTCASILESDADGKVVGGWIDGGDSLDVTRGVAKDVARLAARIAGRRRPEAGTRCDPGGTLTPVSDTTARELSPEISALIAEAEQGDRSAQLELAIRYAHGAGVAKDEALALRWCRLAAEVGDPIAQTELAQRYDTGWGLPNDDAAALEWIRKAAAQEYPEALLQLGVRHLHGTGVRRDLVQASQFYRRAAEAGHPRAMCYLGDMYVAGTGVARSLSEAYRWYVSAVTSGYARCEPNMTRAGSLLGRDERAAAEREGRNRAVKYNSR